MVEEKKLCSSIFRKKLLVDSLEKFNNVKSFTEYWRDKEHIKQRPAFLNTAKPLVSIYTYRIDFSYSFDTNVNNRMIGKENNFAVF